MSESDDDLLAGLSRSADPADRRLADLLGGLVPPSGRQVVGPRASETLAAFLAANVPVAAAPLDTVTEPDPAPDVVVELGRIRPRRRSMRSHLVSLRTLLRTSLLAKVVLGATVVLTGAGAVAATAGPDTSRDVVTVVPASDSGDSGGDDGTGVLEVDDDHEGLAHEGDIDDGPDPDDADEPDDDGDDQGDDGDDQGEDGDDQGEDGDDQGEDADDQGEDADDHGEDGDDQGDDADEESDESDDADDADDADENETDENETDENETDDADDEGDSDD